MIFEIDKQFSNALRDALTQLESAKHIVLPADAISESALRWEIPKSPSFGDLSSPIAFKLTAICRQSPQQIADELSSIFLASCKKKGFSQYVDRLEVKAGFLNVFLSQSALIYVLRAVLKERNSFGTRRNKAPSSINIEFVSANPTGPLSVAHGRQAAVGDVLARLLRSQGHQVVAEYYLNDEGRQIELLGRSLLARYAQLLGKQESFPEDGYHGDYIQDIAKDCVKKFKDRLLKLPEQDALPILMTFGMDYILGWIMHDLKRFGLTFDRWSSQKRLRVSGKIQAALDLLKEKGALYESDGATWFSSTKFGDDKDRVICKRDGELTYLAPDIAYHQWKFQRGHDQLVNLWGPDHHGYIMRLKAAVAALGLPADRLTVRIVQLVTLSRKGKPVPMSKRQGEFVTFREIMDEVGVDASRFFFLMRTMDSHLDFDLELAKAHSQENPVYYVQYAYARICSIFAKASWKARFTFRLEPRLLKEPEELLLVRTLFQYPIVLSICASALEPHGLTVYLRKLAETFHVFYTKHRVISEDNNLSASRLALVKATRYVLANALHMLGVSAPTSM